MVRLEEKLQAGARIFEYQPTMIHAKTMIVDGVWVVVGSTNLDSRSFGLEQDFETDLKQSRQISYDEWKRRSIVEKIGEWFGWLLINEA